MQTEKLSFLKVLSTKEQHRSPSYEAYRKNKREIKTTQWKAMF